MKINAQHTRLRPAAGSRTQTHPAEIDLQLTPGLAIGHPHRDPPAPARTAALHGEALQGARRHHHPPATQQRADLDHR